MPGPDDVRQILYVLFEIVDAELVDHIAGHRGDRNRDILHRLSALCRSNGDLFEDRVGVVLSIYRGCAKRSRDRSRKNGLGGLDEFGHFLPPGSD